MVIDTELNETVGKVGCHSGNTTLLERPTCSYENNSERFIVQGRTFDRQYAPFYIARLSLSTKIIHEKARKKWGQSILIKKLCDVCGDEQVVVFGTLFKHMELHPSILKEICEEHHLIPQAVVDHYTIDDDFLILEDDLQRITLCGNIDPHTHVTGIIVAVLGSVQEGGKFDVEDVCYTFVPDPTNPPVIEKNRYVVMVSGLGLLTPDALFPIQLLIDYITGQLGEDWEQGKASQIVRVILAGNSINESSKDKDFTDKAKYLTRKTKASTVEGIKALDDVLTQLAASVEVDVMPGEFDPANHLMPQQPLHPIMFPKASKYSTFHCTTNPYDATICGIRFLGTSGQNIKNIMSYSRINEPVKVMEKTLDWGHLSPTAPDTLNCYPYFDKDPFLISECPHLYFSGNMPKFASSQYGSSKNPVTIVSIPKFCETFTAAMVNLRTMKIEPFVFSGFEK